MQAHPDPHRDPVGPVMHGQRPLRRHAAPDRIPRRPEHDEEAVPLGPHIPPAERGKRGAQQGALSRERLAVPVTKSVQQHRRALDVAEQHRDRPRRELPHAPIIGPACLPSRNIWPRHPSGRPRAAGGSIAIPATYLESILTLR
jgi:hypothetical protein